MNSEESRLSRWSRRKLEAKQQAEPQHEQLQDDRLTGAVFEQGAAAPDSTAQNTRASNEAESILTDEDMPDIDSLNEDSDFSGFMSPGVSDELRNLALRKLFAAPSFNIRDGLDEYDEDYTSFEKLGDIVTSDMKHQLEMEAQKKLEREQEELIQQKDTVGSEKQQPSPEPTVEDADEQQVKKRSEESSAQTGNNDDPDPSTTQPSPSISEEHYVEYQS